MPEKPEYAYIGKHVNRTDAPDIVTGRTRFIDDLPIPGMLHGFVLRSPHPHAILKRVDCSAARRAPGVKAALSWEDAPDWVCGLPHHRRVLDSKVRMVGDSVALVAADTRERARLAAKLIEVEYEVLPFVLDVEESELEGAPQLYDQFPGNRIPDVTPFSEIPFKSIHVGEPSF